MFASEILQEFSNNKGLLESMIQDGLEKTCEVREKADVVDVAEGVVMRIKQGGERGFVYPVSFEIVVSVPWLKEKESLFDLAQKIVKEFILRELYYMCNLVVEKGIKISDLNKDVFKIGLRGKPRLFLSIYNDEIKVTGVEVLLMTIL